MPGTLRQHLTLWHLWIPAVTAVSAVTLDRAIHGLWSLAFFLLTLMMLAGSNRARERPLVALETVQRLRLGLPRREQRLAVLRESTRALREPVRPDCLQHQRSMAVAFSTP